MLSEAMLQEQAYERQFQHAKNLSLLALITSTEHGYVVHRDANRLSRRWSEHFTHGDL